MNASQNNSGGAGDDDIRVAEYVLGLLEGAEHDEMARRVADEPDLAEKARFWQLRLSTLDDAFDPVAPPKDGFAAVEARLFGAPVRASLLGRVWNSLVVWRVVAAGAIAVALVVVGMGLFRPAPLGPEDFAHQLVASIGETGGSVQFLALYDPTTGKVRLTGVSGAHAADKDFELWMIKGGNAPVSMGVLPAGGQTSVTLPPGLSRDFTAGTVLAITLEQKGGSPTGAPQGPLVAKGTATAI